MEIQSSALLLESPFRGYLSGSSGSGKSAFILRLLENRSQICKSTFERIIYSSIFELDHLSEKDAEFHKNLRKTVPFIELTSSLPDLDEIRATNRGPTLLILDDLITEIIDSEQYSKLFTSFSAHSNISVLTTAQNFFEQGKYAKTIVRNQTFHVIFNSRGDNQSISMISRKMFPHDKHFLNECFKWLSSRVSEQYKRYLFIDCSNSSNLPPTFPQVKTNLFNECAFFSPLFFVPK